MSELSMRPLCLTPARRLLLALALATFAVAAQGRPALASACEARDARFICGLPNAEDLVRVPGTPFVIASDRAAVFGPLSLIDSRNHAVRALYPGPGSGTDWDRRHFPDCTAPPARISSHGLNVRPASHGLYRLYVVNHGGRESVEIFDATVADADLRLTWRGCVLAPEGLQPNGVAQLPDGGIVLSGGKVALWHPGSGWKTVKGLTGGNGVEVSADGRWLLVAISVDGTVVRLPVSGEGPQTATSVGFRPDNLRYDEKGDLYVAGQAPASPTQIPQCLKPETVICDIGFAYAIFDPQKLVVHDLHRYDGFSGAFGGGTTALQIGNQMWVGTFRGDRVAVMPQAISGKN